MALLTGWEHFTIFRAKAVSLVSSISEGAMKIMKKRVFVCIVVGACTLFASVQASAVEWATVGARAAGMGRAGVAVTSDAYAIYWNPAGLAMSKIWTCE